MPSEPRCEHVRALIPELALGIADGEERAEALAHVDSCPDCRRVLEEHSELADELLLLTPSHEPPGGFESRVLERLELRPTPRRRLARPLALVAAALTAAAVAATGTWVALGDDRQLASQYRGALDRVGGEYFDAAQLRAGNGVAAGRVFGYRVTRRGCSCSSTATSRPARSGGRSFTRDGRQLALPSLDAARGTWGGAIPIPFRDVAAVRLSRGDGEVLEARLPEP